MKDEIRKILQIIYVNEDFLDEQNRTLIKLFMKLDADDMSDIVKLPPSDPNDIWTTNIHDDLPDLDHSDHIEQVILRLLQFKWYDNEKEKQHLSTILDQLRDAKNKR